MSQSGHGTVFVLGGILLVVGDSADDDDDDVMIFSTSDEDDDSTNDAERDDKLGNSFDCCCCDDVANKTVTIWGSTDKEERLLTAMMEKADDVDRSRNRNVVALHQ